MAALNIPLVRVNLPGWTGCLTRTLDLERFTRAGGGGAMKGYLGRERERVRERERETVRARLTESVRER